MTPTSNADHASDGRSKQGDDDSPIPENLGETRTHIGDTAAPPGSGTAAASASGEWIGRRLGRYEIKLLLGVGGMGMVYMAHDTLIERDVAIKILPQDISRDELSLKRFLAEARAAGKLSQANAVDIYEVGQHEGIYYLVMEYVAGGSVGDQLDRGGPFSVLDATRITADACRGLVAAHAVGLVHRDIKPANLLRDLNGTVKVADFGLAKPALGGEGQLTRTGHIVGTPYFMSPEQCEARPIDHRSDLYSLGATYYTLLTGINPYHDAGSIVQVMFAHCQGAPLDPRKSQADLPAACAQIIERATAKRPDDRYQSAEQMLGDLDALAAALAAGVVTSNVRLTHGPPPKRRKRLIGAGIVAAAVLIAAAVPAAPTGPPIRVGVLHSLSGTMAESESAVVEATLLAIDELNKAGGLLGRPVEPLVRDGRSDDAVFADEATKLITRDRVSTVFGCWTSSSRKTVLPVFERNNHLLVYPVEYEGLEQSPNVVYLGATPNQQIIPALKWAFAFGGKRKFFIVGSDYIFPRAASAIVHDEIGNLGGQIVGEEYLPLGSYDVKSIVAKIVDAKPDAILNTINGDSNVAFFKELRAQGVAPGQVPTISFSIGEEELRHLNVSQMVGDYAAWSYFQSIDTSDNRGFVNRFKAKYGPQRVVTDPMEAAYLGVKLWAQAVEQARSDDVTKIRRAMIHQTIVGPEGEVQIDPSTQHVLQTARIGRVRADGQFDVEWSAARPDPAIPFPASRSRQEWKEFLDEWYVRWGHHWGAPNE
jgi:urea transport system substrate-binding protein